MACSGPLLCCWTLLLLRVLLLLLLFSLLPLRSRLLCGRPLALVVVVVTTGLLLVEFVVVAVLCFQEGAGSARAPALRVYAFHFGGAGLVEA